MLKLLKNRSFGSLVLSQFLGAFNDNAFKQLILLLTVGAATAGAIPWVQESGLAVDASGVNRQELPATLFALPFVVLCLVTGALADRFSKSTIIKVANVLEVVVMAMGLLAIYLESYLGLLLVVGCMGAQSALFGPSKYGILKELLDERDMSRANALIQTTTTVAILGGVVVAGELLDRFPDQLWLPGLAYVGIAVAGLAASLAIRHEPARVPEREIPWNLPAEFVRHWKALRGHPTLAVSIAGSAFYYLVASLLVLVVNEYGLIELGLSSAATSRLMLPVIVGIGLGAVVGGKLSGDRVEGGLVPLGLFGMTGALVAIQLAPANLLWVQGCLGFLGLSSGIFSLPIRTLVQVLPAEEDRGSVLGFSQVLDFAGILLAAPCLLLLKAMSLSPPEMMIAIAVLILLGFAVSLRFAAHFTVRLVAWIFAHTVYRTRLLGAEHLPQSGGALLVANHVSFVDAVLVAASSGRPVRFLMYRGFFKVPLLGWFARKMEAIPVSSQDSKSEKVAALSAAADAAARGELVCIFAEGGLTRSGHLMSFAAGLERIAREARVPILPVALDRLWGSIFSHEGGKVFWKLPRRLPFKVDVSIGAPMSPDASAFQVRQRIAEQVAELRTERQGRRGSLAWRFLKEARANAGRPAVLDSTGVDLNYRKLLVGALCMRDALRPHLGEARSVAVLMPPGAGGALVNLALALDGRTSVNLNYTMSNGDLAAMCETAGAEHVITARRFLSGLERPSPLGEEQTILLEEIRGSITSAMKLRYLALSFLPGVMLANLLAPRSRSGRPESEDVATVIFSSGSTGVPKGVMLTHSNVLSNVQSVLEVIALGPGDGVLGILPFFHSFGYTITLWATFLSGARGVYHVNPLEAKVVGELSQKGGVTITIATPTFYQSYLRRCTKEQFAGIRVALSGAQKLNQGLADAWKAKFGSELMEGYGCTEAAPVVSANLPGGDHLPPRQRGHREGSIGRPIPGVAVKIVDPDVYPAEVIEREGGESGLILVKGPNVMKGYIGMPEKTAEVLRDGWYTTGDIGHIDRDGFLFITDRLSRFSKIGGEMVPHGRVEEVIGDLMFELLGPSSQEAEEDGVVPELAVTAVEHETKGERLIVLHTPMPFELDELKERLSGSDLPALFRPAPNAWVEVPELPKLGTGKLDLRGLSDLARELVGSV
jgi:acyl-[acyl-carrier-protein]-phospholipid O-acyltransferase/long-chain-fatty-acid--[acyl-carrier-protein] ligase